MMIQDADHLFRCDNCGRLVLEDTSTGRTAYYIAASEPRIRVDPTDRDSLGRIRLRCERSLKDLEGEKVILSPGVRIVAYWDGGEVAGSLFTTVIDGELVSGEWALAEM